MSWLKKHLGLDWIDLAIHAGVTAGAATLFVNQGDLEGVPIVITASVALLGVRRWFALRSGSSAGQLGLTSGEMAAVRFEEMEERLAELEELRARVAELETRADFAERLLARGNEHQPVQPGDPR